MICVCGRRIARSTPHLPTPGFPNHSAVHRPPLSGLRPRARALPGRQLRRRREVLLRLHGPAVRQARVAVAVRRESDNRRQHCVRMTPAEQELPFLEDALRPIPRQGPRADRLPCEPVRRPGARNERRACTHLILSSPQRIGSAARCNSSPISSPPASAPASRLSYPCAPLLAGGARLRLQEVRIRVPGV